MSGRKRIGANGRILEFAVKNDVKRILDALPKCFYFMPSAGVFGIVGISDIIGVCNGKFFALEIKRDSLSSTTFPQKIFLANVRRTGGLGLVVTSENIHELWYKIALHCFGSVE